MADLISIVHDVTAMTLTTLGQQQDGGQPFSFRDLYSVFGLVALLAMFNATLVMSYLALGALKYANQLVIGGGKSLYFLSLILQSVLGLAPVILIVRALMTDSEVSFRVYGMPGLQLVFIALMIFYQIRVVIMYTKIQKKSSLVAGT